MEKLIKLENNIKEAIKRHKKIMLSYHKIN